jgi:hypothetical protein
VSVLSYVGGPQPGSGGFVIVFAVFAVFAQDIESFLPSKKWKDCDFSVSRDREGVSSRDARHVTLEVEMYSTRGHK